MSCARCQHLESELDRLERAHAEKAGILRSNGGSLSADEYNRIRVAESDARLELDIAQGELNQHRWNHQKTN